ncbi:MAG: hypothetical protein J6D29_01675 [Solobacterium sp.]|nr:hypothetical protein [Solobacterium sp.]
MTNEQIIMNERFHLMEKGILKGTGKFIKALIINSEGIEEEMVIEIPEEIHTYGHWRELGYQVQKGQKAVAKFGVWKYTEKEKENGEKDKRMFIKHSAFFAPNQVEVIE